MKFNRLKASIANNLDQQPSIYMALCLVESLFEDIEDESGRDISECLVGDEGLSSKLVWLCRTINSIYDDKQDELQRNRARLDAAMEKLKKTEGQLADFAASAVQLAALQREHSSWEQKLLAAQENKRQCELLTQQCESARRQLEQLQDFDPAVANAHLTELTDRIAKLERNKVSVCAQAQDLAQQAQMLQQQIRSQEADIAAYQQQIQSLDTQLAQKKRSAAQMQDNLASLQEEQTAVSAQLAQSRAQQEESACKVAALQRDLDACRNQQLAPVLQQITLLKQELAQSEENRLSVNKEHEQLANQRSELILNIAITKEANEAERENLKSAQEKLERLKNDKLDLEKQRNAIAQTLSALQEEVEQLTGQKIPEFEKLVDQETQRKETLLQQIASSEETYTQLCADIQSLEAKLPELEVNLSREKEVYDSLTANYTASTTELKSLERQVSELRDKNDAEKLAIYRKQLEDNLRELENIRTDCQNIQLENVRLVKELEAGQNERFRLLELKQKHETGSEATAKQLRELEFAGTPEYINEVTAISQRLELLEMVRSKLAASVSKIRKILGQVPFEGEVSLEDQLSDTLHELSARADDLRRSLLECADNLKMEEQQ